VQAATADRIGLSVPLRRGWTMNRAFHTAAVLFVAAFCCALAPGARAQSKPSIQRAQVLRTQNQLEIEIDASDHVVPQTHLIAGPDRLIVDFVNAVPGPQLRNQVINRGEVKSLRVGLFSADPPVTRLVFDLNGPQAYQIFPSGRTVIIKVGGNAGASAAAFHPSNSPVLVQATYGSPSVQSAPAPSPKPLEVAFQNGLLTIRANKASLSEILYSVHQRTGAEIAIPAGAEQEKVVTELGPAPAPEVLAHLLNGSKFNFLILSSAKDPRVLDQVILSSRGEGATAALPPRPSPQAYAPAPEPEPAVQEPPPGRATEGAAQNANPNGQPAPGGAPETKPANDDSDQ